LALAPATIARPREAELLAVATRLFRERGFHATSMQDLAEALGMNRGSLYHYIAAKDDLLWRIVDGALERLDAHVRPVLETGEPGAARLREAIRGHLSFAAEHADELALLQIELRSLPPDRRAEIIARRDAYEAMWRAAMTDAVAEDALPGVDVRLSTIAVLSACNWFTQWYRPDGLLGVDEISERFADFFLAARR
jgi:TetR/AcrR family transcriptional regulator, cholesterol catabolism regulator